MDVNALYKARLPALQLNDLAGALSDFAAVAAASSAIEGVVALAFGGGSAFDMREEAAAAVLLAAERAAAAARADAAVLPAFCEMTAQLLGSLRHVDDAVRSIDDDCRQRRDARRPQTSRRRRRRHRDRLRRRRYRHRIRLNSLATKQWTPLRRTRPPIRRRSSLSARPPSAQP